MAKAYNNYSDIIDFTRASSGTALRPVSYSDELVENGTFDSDVSGWTGPSSATFVYSNGKAVYTSNGDYNDPAYQQITLSSGKAYLITFDVSNVSGEVGVRVYGDLSYNNASIEINDVANGSYSETFVAQTNDAYLYIVESSPTNVGSATFDNISVREVIFDQSDAPLTLFNHPTNIPRIEYDADGNRLGLLVEEQRTNLVKYSEPDNRSSSSTVGEWTFTRLNPLTEITNVLGPDGVSDSARQCLLSSISPDACILQVPVISGNKYTVSAYVKLGSASNFAIHINNATIWNSVSDGYKTFTSADGLNAESFKRVSITFTAPATNKVNVHIGGHSSALHDQQDDGTVVLYGFQLEAGSFMTSAIPTSGVTATRSADVASVDVTDFGYNEGNGSLLVECNVLGIKPNTTHGVAALYNSTNNRHYMYFYNTLVGGVTLDEGGSQANIYGKSDYLADDFVKTSYSYKKDSFVSAVDGETPATDSAGTLPENLNYLYIGRSDTSQYLNGHIKSIKYYPRALTAAQLQELTS